MKWCIRFVVLVTLLHTASHAVAEEVCLIPTPKSAIFHNGKYQSTAPLSVAIGDNVLIPIADYLSLYISIDKDDKSSNLKLNIDNSLALEEYHLIVGPSGISITGGSYGGVFNGVTTLFQLLPTLFLYSSNASLQFSY